MSLRIDSYSVLVVSSTNTFNQALSKYLSLANMENVSFTSDISSARRILLENNYDFLIINSPVNNISAIKFACDSSGGNGPITLMFIPSIYYSESISQLNEHGVFVISKPASDGVINHGLNWMISAHNRFKKLEKKAISIESKMQEIRLVNKAKWLLIENLKMNEQQAHHYIEKQAMDNCLSKVEIANNIISTYDK